MDEQIKHRFDVLTWAIAFVAALTIAELGMVTALAVNAITLSHQLGLTIGRLDVLIDHVQLR
jgi:uncharacterized membrane protein YczE